MASKRIKLTIESNLDDVPLVGIAVNRFCVYASLSETDAFNVELCVVEAVTNSIKHAYDERGGREITIIFSLFESEVVFEICDTGRSMDPEKLKKADLSHCPVDKDLIETISEGGRGLGIMKKIMDHIEYRSENETNCLILKKKIL
ncbi:ATPase/histidine kinase/DNA gyrase B/HSP90 domain protein [delta proteobacterium NaphS2]|nr:ATPase/histidine kinase/DNA gyrase B/HSP90 domain protein [delta proteobacterium NaphS2]